MIYKFRQPHKCQNGHFNYLYFELHGDKLVNHRWGEPKCNCPKWAIDEGYSPCGETEMWSELRDINNKEIYKGDICLLDENYGDMTYVIVFDLGCFLAQMIPYKENRCELMTIYNKIEIIGNIHENSKLLEGIE